MEVEGNKYMEAARDEMKKINQDEVTRWLYLRREMAESDEKSRLVTARHEGERIGEARGEARGIVIGEARGEARGIALGASEEAARFSKLTKCLLEASRLEDLKRVTEDEEFKKQLYHELGIE